MKPREPLPLGKVEREAPAPGALPGGATGQGLRGCLAGLLLLTSADAAAMSATGEAYGVEDGALRYREEHRCAPSGGECTVEYRDPAGQLFARKRLDYRESAHAPRLQMEDFRGQQSLSVAVAPAPGLVIDAGFDNFVRDHWATLAGGGEMRFEFLPAGRERPLRMRARRAERECPASRLCLSIELQNWLLAALVDAIELEYDTEQRRLRLFKGISNIRDNAGASQRVRIIYRYQAEAAVPGA